MIPKWSPTQREEFLSTDHIKVLGRLEGSNDVCLVKDVVSGTKYILKIYEEYNLNVFEYLIREKPSGVPSIPEVFECEDKLYVLEERVQGETLQQRINNLGPMDVRRAVEIIMELCHILEQFHSTMDKVNRKPIIHRDLAPKNVMIGEDDRITLIDFNVSREVSMFQSKDTKLLASADYAAPEQIGGYTQSDVRTDIFALGGILIFLTTGEIPNSGYRYMTGELKQIVDLCLKKEKEERYASVNELEQALRHLVFEKDYQNKKKTKSRFCLFPSEEEKLKKEICDEARTYFIDQNYAKMELMMEQTELYLGETLSEAYVKAEPEKAYLFENLKAKYEQDQWEYLTLEPDDKHNKYRILIARCFVNERSELTGSYIAALGKAYWEQYAKGEGRVSNEDIEDAGFIAWSVFMGSYEKALFDIYRGIKNEQAVGLTDQKEILLYVLAKTLSCQGAETVTRIKGVKDKGRYGASLVLVYLMMYDGVLYATLDSGFEERIHRDYLERSIPVYLANCFDIRSLIELGSEFRKAEDFSGKMTELVEELLIKCLENVQNRKA